ncbi:acyl-CoA dehydrogenase/oxidase [Mycena floridula]|nr:acyl-CoA dehydrogenase/oxidase [Mycena floridula]
MLSVSREQVAVHNKPDDLWLVIDNIVYDLSRFTQIHPGGLNVLLEHAGQEATEPFFALHRREVLQRYSSLRIGFIDGEGPPVEPDLGALSTVPYAEPTWLSQGYHSPYYKEHHRKFQRAFRTFVMEKIYPDAQAREADGKPPSQSVFDEMARLNIFGMRLGPGPHLNGLVLMDGLISPQEFDEFHELIMTQELARVWARGYNDGLAGGTLISLPLILKYGNPTLRQKIQEEVFSGKKFSCLAVTEAVAGSDVANIRCSASRTSDGWVVNGSYKWITNAMWAHYFVTACRTDKGHVVLLIERCAGLETKPIPTLYSACAGTAFVTFDDVHVPFENTLCYEKDGLHPVLSNFNHERWAMATGSIATSRMVTEECLKWVTLRKVFGRPLSSQPVVRSKLAAMIAACESCQSWLENITYQMTQMNQRQQQQQLAGQLAFLKMYASRAGQDISRDAVQIFGGRGITRTGMGRMIEHHHRTLLIDAIGGGAEDILGDLGVRQALKSIPVDTRL